MALKDSHKTNKKYCVLWIGDQKIPGKVAIENKKKQISQYSLIQFIFESFFLIS